MTAIDPGPVIPEREFLGLSDREHAAIDKALERARAAEVAADMLVHWFRTGTGMHPAEFAGLRAAVEGWEKAR